MQDAQDKPAPRRFSLFPKSIAKTVEQVVKPVYKKHGFAEHRILTQWPDIVGPALASCSIPQKLTFSAGKKEKGILHILVASGRALELQHMQPIILDKVATYFGYPAVARLMFVQTSTALFRKKTTKPLPPSPPPSDALVALVSECEDAELRKALLSLGTTLAIVEN